MYDSPISIRTRRPRHSISIRDFLLIILLSMSVTIIALPDLSAVYPGRDILSSSRASARAGGY